MGPDGTPSSDRTVKYITLIRITGSSLYLTTSERHSLQLLCLNMRILLSALWEYKKISQQEVATDSSQVTK